MADERTREAVECSENDVGLARLFERGEDFQNGFVMSASEL